MLEIVGVYCQKEVGHMFFQIIPRLGVPGRGWKQTFGACIVTRAQGFMLFQYTSGDHWHWQLLRVEGMQAIAAGANIDLYTKCTAETTT